jgi:hypothetical protein
MRIFIPSKILFAMLLLTTSPAQAAFNVWQDAATGMKLAYPDSWARGVNSDSDRLVTLVAPSSSTAQCHVSARADKRFMIYPPEYDRAVQKVAYSNDFWQSYTAKYNEVEFYRMIDGASLGQSIAGYAVARYKDPRHGGAMRASMMAAALHHDTAYIFECSADIQEYNRVRDVFVQIMNSIDFKSIRGIRRIGQYPAAKVPFIGYVMPDRQRIRHPEY